MKVIPTEIEGVVLLEPEVFGDARGYFFESYSEQSFDRLVRPVRFVQDNESMSKYGVLRGLHSVSYTHLDVYKRQMPWLPALQSTMSR